MDKINRLLEHSARYFGLDGAPPERWDERASHPEGDAARRRARRSAAVGNTTKDREKACSPMRRAFTGRR